MVFDAGRVVFYGDADLTGVEHAIKQMDGYATQVEDAFEKIKPVVPKLDVGQVVESLGEVKAAVTDTFRDAAVITPRVDDSSAVADATTAAAAVADRLANIPPARITVDDTALTAAAEKIAATTLDLPPLHPVLDTSALTSEALEAAATVSAALMSGVEPVTLHADDAAFLDDAAAAAAAVQDALAIPPVPIPLDTASLEEGAAAAAGILTDEFAHLPPVAPPFDNTTLETGADHAAAAVSARFKELPPVAPAVDLEALSAGTERGVELMTRAFDALPPVAIEVDPEQVKAQGDQAQAVLDGLFGDVEPVDEIVDESSAQSQGAAAVATVESQFSTLPPVKIHIDQAQARSDAADAAASAADEFAKHAGHPHLDTHELEQDKEKVLHLAEEVTDALRNISGGRVSLEVGQLEAAGADAMKVISTLTAGFTAAGIAAAAFATVAVAAVGEFAKTVTEMGESAEAAFRKFSVAMGVTGEQLHVFEQNAINVFQATGKAPEATLPVMAQLNTRLKLTGEALESTATSTLKYAKVTEQDGVGAAVKLSQILTAFHEPATNAAQDMNILLRVSQQTGIPIGQLQDQLSGRLVPTLQQLGFDLAGSALLLGKFSQQGDSGRLAIQGFNRVMQEAVKSGQEPKAVWAETVEQLKLVGDASTSSSTRLREQLGPAYAYFVSLAKNGALDIGVGSKAIKETGDTVDEAAKRIKSGSENIGSALSKLGAQFAPLGIQIATAIKNLQDGLAGGIDKVTEAIKAFMRAKEEFDRQQAAAHGAGEPSAFDAAAAFGGGGGQFGGAPGQGGVPSGPAPGGHETPGGGEGGAPGENPLKDKADEAVKSFLQLDEAIRHVEERLKGLGSGPEAQGMIESLLTEQKALQNLKHDLEALDPAEHAAVAARLLAAQSAFEHADALKVEGDALKEQATAANAAGDAASDASRQLDAQSKALHEAADAAANSAFVLHELNKGLQDFTGVSDAAIEAALAAAQATRASRDMTEAEAEAEDKHIAAMVRELAARHNSAEATRLYAAAAAAADESDNKAAEGADRHRQAIEKGAEAAKTLTDAQLALGAANTLFTTTASDAAEGAARTNVEWERLGGIFNAIKPSLNESQQALLNLAVRNHDLEGAMKLVQQVTGATDAQMARLTAGYRGNAEEAARAAEAAATLAKGLSGIASDDAKERSDSLFKSLLDGADAGTRAQAEYTKGVEGSTAALEVFRQQGVLSAEDIAKALSGTKAALEEVTRHAQAAQKGFEGFFRDEQASNAKKVFDDLTVGMNAAQLAQAKLTAESKGYEEAVREMAASAPGGFAQVEAAINGDVFALKALELQAAHTKEALNAAATYQATGVIPPASKPPDAAEQYREANQKIAESVAEADEKLREGVKRLQEGYAEAQVDFTKRAADIDDALAAAQRQAAEAMGESANQLAVDLGKAMAAYREAEDRYHKGVAETNLHADEAIRKASESYAEASKNLGESFAEQMAQIDKATASALEANTKAHQAAFKAQADAMSQFNEQQIAMANSLSIAQENARIQNYGFTDPQSVASNKRAQEIQAAGTAALQQAAASNALNKAMRSAQEQAADADKTYQGQLKDLEEQREKARKKAAEAWEKAREKYDKEILKAEEERSKKLKELSDELAKATTKMKEAQDKAYQDFAARQIKIREALAKAQQTHDRDMKKLMEDKEKARLKYNQAMEDLRKEDAKQRRKFETDRERAASDFQRAINLVNEGMARHQQRGNTLLQGILEQRQGQLTVRMDNTNIQETNVAFLKFGMAELDRAMGA